MVDEIPKRKLLIATDSFIPRWDGIARFLYEVVPYLSEHFDITIAAPKFPGEFKGLDNAAVIRFPTYKRRFGDINPAKFRRKQMKKLVKRADIVWTQSIGFIGGLAMHYAKRMKRPLVAYVHSVEWFLFSKSLKRCREFVEFTIRKLVPFLYNKCSLIMIPFEGMAPILEGQGIMPKKEVVYLGIDPGKFKPPESKRAAKERLGLDPDRLVIGYLGRFGREKDVETLYRAFRKLHLERRDVSLLLVGGSMPLEDTEDVRMVGPVDEPLPYYQAMDVYVLPSLTETTSLTTMEAMACGLPVVVTPVGYVEKYVEHKANGFVFPCGNVDRLYIILTKLASDSKLRERLGSAARRTMVEKHSWKRTAGRIAEILKRY